MIEQDDDIASMSRKELKVDLLDWAYKTALQLVLDLPNVFELMKSYRPDQKEFIQQMLDTLVVAAAWFTSDEDSKIRKKITKIASQVSQIEN